MTLIATMLGVLAAAGSPLVDDADTIRAELLGALEGTRLSVTIEDAPAREVLEAIAVAIDVPIIGRYIDDRVDHGLDPDVPISLQVDDESALLVLELVLEQATLYDETTWQLRNGYVEVGTKHRLSIPGASVRRLYPIDDLLLEPPYYQSRPTHDQDLVLREFRDHPYHTAALGLPTFHKSPAELVRELFRGVTELVEPGNWDHGQLRDEHGRTRRMPDRIASIRFWGGQFIITAPDFVHRQVTGYPTPTWPQAITEDERVERSAEASGERLGVTVTRVIADVPGARPDRWFADQADDHERLVRRLVGVLLYTRLSVDFVDLAAREAFDQFASLLDIEIIGRYADDGLGYGIDPLLPVELSLDDVPALIILEELLAQCSIQDPCTWQIRLGFIEVGTKARLSVPAARELRTYSIRDLMIDTSGDRRYPLLLALDLVQETVESFDPESWDFGQIDYDEDDGGVRVSAPPSRGNQAPSRPQDRGVPITARRRHVPAIKPATIRYWRDLMIVRAPDYLHREIDGYPVPNPPVNSTEPGVGRLETPAGADPRWHR